MTETPAYDIAKAIILKAVSGNRIVSNGYTYQELKSAFDRVCDPDDWKASIKAHVYPHEVRVVEEAITYFTATEADVMKIEDGDEVYYYVESIGYRMGPAGDH